jgi:hypothetical protein
MPVPKIVNIADIQHNLDVMSLLHINAEQWKQLVHKLEPNKLSSEGTTAEILRSLKLERVPMTGSALEIHPMPGGRGILLAATLCPPGCTPTWDYHSNVPTDPGQPDKPLLSGNPFPQGGIPGREPIPREPFAGFEQIMTGCNCSGTPLAQQPPPPCRIGIRFSGRVPEFVCLDSTTGQLCTNTKPVWYALTNGSHVLMCQ